MASQAPLQPALNQQDVLVRLRSHYPHFRDTYGVQKMGLFGSFAQGPVTSQSDVDLVVDFDRPVGFRFIDLVDELEALLGRRVDVLTPTGLRGIRVPEVARQIEESLIDV